MRAMSKPCSSAMRLTIASRGSPALFAGSAEPEDSSASSPPVDGKALISLPAFRPYVAAYLPINRPADAGWGAEALVAGSDLSNRRDFGRQQGRVVATRARSAGVSPGIHG